MLDLIGLSGIEGWPHPDMRCRHDDLPQTWYLPSNAGWEYSEGTKTPWVGALLAGGGLSFRSFSGLLVAGSMFINLLAYDQR